MYVYFNLGIEDKKPSVRLVSSSNLLLLLTNPLIRIDKTLGLPEKLLNKCTNITFISYYKTNYSTKTETISVKINYSVDINQITQKTHKVKA